MKATLSGDFGAATIDLPDNAKDDPTKLQAYIDHFEKHAADIKSGAMPLPDFDTFSGSEGSGFPQPGHGMGDVKMAESRPAPMNPHPFLPSRAQMGRDAFMQGEEVNPVMGALATLGDVANIPTRAAAQLRGQDMSDPNAYFFRPEGEAARAHAQEALDAQPDLKNYVPPAGFGGMPMMMPTPAMSPELTEQGAILASDPTFYLSLGGKAIAGLTRKGLEALHGAIPGLKNYVSGLSQIKKPLLEKAATEGGMASLSEGAKMSPEELAKTVSDDANKVNTYREDLSRNSQATQQGQVQSINDQLALENQGVNAQLENKATADNAYRDELARNSRATQSQQTEQGILDARRQATGADDAALADIKPGALGEDIKSGVMGGKSEMQDAWLQGDQKSVGPYRAAKAPEVTVGTQKGAKVQIKLLTQRLGTVLDKYKAHDPSEGMRKISAGASSVIHDLMGYAQESGHTVDDLLNIKAELRRARNMDKYKGVPFDLSVDDVAFGDADREIGSVIDFAIKKAAPKEGAAISELMKAKDRQYAITKDLLGDQARSLGQTQNTAAIIQKVKNMGPEKARELIAGAASNPAIAGLVPKLRQAFVDDMILTSMKDGQFDPEKMSRLWKAPGMQEMKVAWLAPEDLKRIDDALSLGTAEIANPAKVVAGRVPMPAKLGSAADRSNGFYNQLARQESEAPPKVGQSFAFNGKPEPVTAETRIKNIGNENDVNVRALADLKVLDKINGTNHAEKAMQIFESGKLGMNTEGALAAHPMQTTGARGYGIQKGQVLGRIVGGIGGGLLGYIAGHGVGAAAGTGPGVVLGDMVAALHSNMASPAGAVASYRKMNAILEAKFPRAAKIAAAMDKAPNAVVRAKLAAMLDAELQKASE